MYMKYQNMDSFKEKIKDINTVVIPIGMIEAHGHHCSLATDILIPSKFCEILNKEIGDSIMIAPAVNYGHSWALSPYPGTINVSMEAFSNYVKEIALEFIRNGFKNIVLLNGHGGNASALSPVAEAIANNDGVSVTFHWWIDFKEEILKITEGQGHAGEDETSAVLAIDESLVDMSKATSNNININGRILFKDFGKLIYKDALSGDATKATKEKGEQIYTSVSKRMIEIIKDVQSKNY